MQHTYCSCPAVSNISRINGLPLKYTTFWYIFSTHWGSRMNSGLRVQRKQICILCLQRTGWILSYRFYSKKYTLSFIWWWINDEKYCQVLWWIQLTLDRTRVRRSSNKIELSEIFKSENEIKCQYDAYVVNHETMTRVWELWERTKQLLPTAPSPRSTSLYFFIVLYFSTCCLTRTRKTKTEKNKSESCCVWEVWNTMQRSETVKLAFKWCQIVSHTQSHRQSHTQSHTIANKQLNITNLFLYSSLYLQIVAREFCHCLWMKQRSIIHTNLADWRAMISINKLKRGRKKWRSWMLKTMGRMLFRWLW